MNIIVHKYQVSIIKFKEVLNIRQSLSSLHYYWHKIRFKFHNLYCVISILNILVISALQMREDKLVYKKQSRIT